MVATSCGCALVEHEADDAGVNLRIVRAQPPHAGDLAERLPGVLEQEALVLAHVLHAQRLQVVDGGAQANRLGDGRRAGLELGGYRVPLRLLEGDPNDHAAAGHEGRHRLQQLAVRPEGADAGRARASCGPTAPGSRSPAAARPPACAAPTAPRRPAPGRRLRGPAATISVTGLMVPSALLTWAMASSFGPWASLSRRSSRSRRPSSVMATYSRRAPTSRVSCCQGTMLAWCSSWVVSDQVAGLHVGAAPAVGHQVDRLGGVAHEDDLTLGRCADEGGHLAPRGLEAVGRVLAQLVDAAVHVGVVVRVGVGDARRSRPAASVRWRPRPGRRAACRCRSGCRRPGSRRAAQSRRSLRERCARSPARLPWPLV